MGLVWKFLSQTSVSWGNASNFSLLIWLLGHENELLMYDRSLQGKLVPVVYGNLSKVYPHLRYLMFNQLMYINNSTHVYFTIGSGCIISCSAMGACFSLSPLISWRICKKNQISQLCLEDNIQNQELVRFPYTTGHLTPCAQTLWDS